jgi:hypothetical protein
MKPYENHGNADYLTLDKLERSAAVDGLNLDEAVKNLVATVEAGKGAGSDQSGTSGNAGRQ